MNRHKWWSLIDILVAIALGTNGALWLRSSVYLSSKESTLRYSQGILGIYLILFAIIIALTAVFYSAFFARYFAAAYSFLGKGFGYIFLGSIAVRDDEWLPLTLGIFVISIGILFILLHFIAAVPTPLPLCYFGNSSTLGFMNNAAALPRTTTTTTTARTVNNSNVFTNPSYGFPPAPAIFSNDPSFSTTANRNPPNSSGGDAGSLPWKTTTTTTTSTKNKQPFSTVPTSPGYVPPSARSFPDSSPNLPTSTTTSENPFTIRPSNPPSNPFGRTSPDHTTTI